MFDPKKLLDQFMGNVSKDGAPGGISPDLLKGAAAGGLAAILLGSKGGRKLAGSAVKLGGIAVLGGLAYRAWQNYNAGTTTDETPPAAATMKDVTPAPNQPARLGEVPDHETSLAILRAMIAAAKADGHIDAAERQAIFGKLDSLGLDTEAKAFMADELLKPLDIEAVAKDATTPERAAQIYAASLWAIEPDDPAEKAYLDNLAERLKLAPGLRASIDAEVHKTLA
jgi:uncharacterized membrane protein YebE (DUF533 family)